MAWAELECYRRTGDLERLHLVYEPLLRYYRALEKYLQQGNGLFMTDWACMDNSPRNPFLKSGDCGVDVSCQMVLFARNLAEIARLLGKAGEARALEREAERMKKLIHRRMWDEQRRYYFDLAQNDGHAPVKAIAAYWALLARVANRSRTRALVAEMQNPKTFARLHYPPTLAADEKDFDPAGGYWRGAVWAPTSTLVIRGLENYDYDGLAREIAFNHLTNIGRVFPETGTLWENYAPDSAKRGKPAKQDFVGWSGIGPILYLLEYGIGLNGCCLRLTPKRSDVFIQPHQGIVKRRKGLKSRQLRSIVHVEIFAGRPGLEALVERRDGINYRGFSVHGVQVRVVRIWQPTLRVLSGFAGAAAHPYSVSLSG